MRCSKVEANLAAYLDGDLPPAQREAVEAHLAACPACRAAAEDERIAHHLLRSLAPVRPLASFAPRVKAAVRAQAARALAQPAFGLDLRGLVAGGVLALMVAALVGWYGSGPQTSYVGPFSSRTAQLGPPADLAPFTSDARAVGAPGAVTPAAAMRRAHDHSTMMASRSLPDRAARASAPAASPEENVAMAPTSPTAASSGDLADDGTTAVARSVTVLAAMDPRLLEAAVGAPGVHVVALSIPASQPTEASASSAPTVETVALRSPLPSGDVSLASLLTDQELDLPSM